VSPIVLETCTYVTFKNFTLANEREIENVSETYENEDENISEI